MMACKYSSGTRPGKAAILISSTFRGHSQNVLRDENFPFSSERRSLCLMQNKLMNGITQHITAKGQIPATQDFCCGHEVFMNQQGNKKYNSGKDISTVMRKQGGRNGRKQGTSQGLMARRGFGETFSEDDLTLAKACTRV